MRQFKIRFAAWVAKRLGIEDQSARIQELEATLERKQQMLDRQFRLCVALTKLEVLAKRRGDLKILHKRKDQVVITSQANGGIHLSGRSIEDALVRKQAA